MNKHQYSNYAAIISFLFCLFLFYGPSFTIAQSMDDLLLYTEPYPPYNFESNGKTSGISVDLLVKILQRSGSTLSRSDIKMRPWARSYKEIQLRKNVMLFSMTRTPHREELFKWMGPIAPTILGLIAQKKKNLTIKGFADVKQLRIGVIREDISHQLLLKNGVPSKKLQPVANTINNISKLNANRIDAWAYDLNVAKWELKSFGFNPDNYEIIYVLQKSMLWYAFNIETPDHVIQKMQDTYDNLAGQGEYQKILDYYLK